MGRGCKIELAGGLEMAGSPPDLCAAPHWLARPDLDPARPCHDNLVRRASIAASRHDHLHGNRTSTMASDTASDTAAAPRRAWPALPICRPLPRVAPTADGAAEATREEMRDARLPIAYRDSCAHLLIPLNKCRRDTWYAPWKCGVRAPALAARSGAEWCGAMLTRRRTSATRTKSASMSSSRSAWPRWTSCASPRAARGATERSGACICCRLGRRRGIKGKSVKTMRSGAERSASVSWGAGLCWEGGLPARANRAAPWATTGLAPSTDAVCRS